jgi:cardiolipin synthase C
MHGDRANFIDLDLLCAGPVVGELGQHFDRYWNSPHAFPIQALADNGLAPAQQLAAFERLTTSPPSRPAPPPPASGRAQVQALRSGRLPLIEAEAAVFFDSPAKTAGAAPPQVLPIASQFGQARSRVLLVSPYFLPSAQGLERMRAARSRGVDIQIITNAVVDSDEPLVGMAYGSLRVEMLRMGVQLFELSSVQLKGDGRLRDALGDGIGRLHLKLALIDDETLIVGSFNLDPRSAAINTEMAVRARSQALAQQLLGELDLVRHSGLLRLRLADDGHTVEWVAADGQVVHRGPDEPGLGAWQRLRLKLLLWLIPEDLL